MSRVALVVDDSLTVRKLVSRCLQQAGFEVIEATNGKEALESAQKHPFALIVTDYNMPIMDGLEFVRSARDIEQHKFTPIVFLTTEGDTAKKDEAKAAGVTAWIIKPFSPEKVLSVVNRVVGAS
jgi:two-component system chemotaxis response regulator CheY